MMFPTNNKFVIKNLTKRTMKANKVRNIFVIIAIALTAFLITTIFSIGMSVIESYQMQQLRTMGTDAHAILTYPTQTQVEKLKSLDYIETVSTQANAASVVNNPKMGNMVLGLHWFDETEWESFRKPAMSGIVGTYPKEYNEIMIPTWILKRMGITDPKIGIEFEIDYRSTKENNVSDTKKQKFVLSAYFTEYMNLRSDNIGSMLVSEAFLNKLGLSPVLSGAASFRFKDNKNISAQTARLEEDIKITDNQKFKVVPLYVESSMADTSTLLGLGCVILFIMLSGYLLIYNVLYISVSKEIRFYGLLKTIGTTPKQIKRIVLGQAWRMAVIGIPIGLVLGTITSFIAVPLALSGSVGMETGVKVSFSPIIFIGAALFSLITTLVSSIKPARKASSVSPIEAIRYTGTVVKGRRKIGTNGGKIYKMAFRNIFRDKKRAIVVFISLFLGITTFLTINTLVLSMDTDNYVSSYVDNDFTLTNNTLEPFSSGAKQKFDNSFMSKIESLEGITDLMKISKEPIVIKYDEKVYKKHIRYFAERYNAEMPTSEEIKSNPDIFWSNLVGIDTGYIEELNKKLDIPINIAAFEKGEIALVSTNNTELYELNSEISFNLTEGGKNAILKLGGFLPERTGYKGGGGLAPNIFISNNKMKELVSDPLIYALSIDTEDASEDQILSQLKQIIGEDNEISIDSRLEMLEQFSSSKIMLYILGGGMSLILALIGILNFVNVMVTGVNVRRQEFAVIESIGMTAKQLKKMLVFEGVAYALISFGLVATLGNAISYGLFRLFQTEADYAIFTFPTLPFVLSFIMIFSVCIIVPIEAYKSTSKQTLTERLRSAEG